MIPPEDGVVTYLNRQGFNQTAIKPAARAYLETLSFLEEAGASESHGGVGLKVPKSELLDDDGEPERPAIVYGGAGVGDLIQWEVGGLLQLEKPMRVRWVSDDAEWVAVEDSDTGIPMSEVIVQERTEALRSPPPIPPAQAARVPPAGLGATAGTVLRTTVFNLPEGDVSLTYPAILTDESVDLLKYQIEGTFKALALAKKAASVLYPSETPPSA